MLKREFLEKGDLHKYKDVLHEIIDMIVSSNCKISACDTCDGSSIEQSKENEEESHIRISFKNKREKPVQVLWDILHEYGHYLSGKSNGREMSIEREQEAWNIGLNILQKYECLKKEASDYLNYQEECLSSYRAYSKRNS